MDMQLDWEGDRRLVITGRGTVGVQDRESLPRRITEAVADRTGPELLLDAEAVDFVDSAGIGVLLLVKKIVEERQGRFVIEHEGVGVSMLSESRDNNGDPLVRWRAAAGLLPGARPCRRGYATPLAGGKLCGEICGGDAAALWAGRECRHSECSRALVRCVDRGCQQQCYREQGDERES